MPTFRKSLDEAWEGERWGPTAARGLGVFSIGLGLVELLAPHALKRGLGLDHPSGNVIRTAYGLRELGAGVGLLAQPHRAGWMWARVAGDGVDLLTLMAGEKSTDRRPAALRAALASTVAITAMDLLVALRLQREPPATSLLHRGFPSLAVREHAAMIDKRIRQAALPLAAAWLRRAREADKRTLITGGVVVAGAAAAVGATLAVRASKSETAKGSGRSDEHHAKDGDKFIERSVTVNKPRDELYRQWRDFSNLPRWMETVDSITVSGDTAHWTVRGPGDKMVEYDTRITEDRPGEVIAWESTGGDVKTESRIEFKDAPGGRGTEVHAKVDYHPPLGPLGKIAAVVTQKGPELQARRDLKQFKMLMETGEIATTEGPGAAPSSKYNKH